MALENDDNVNVENLEEIEPGYIRAHIFDKEKQKDIMIEFMQTGLADTHKSTTIKCEDKVMEAFWRYELAHLIVPPRGNSYIMLGEMLEEAGFTIDMLSTFVYPTHNEAGFPIFY